MTIPADAQSAIRDDNNMELHRDSTNFKPHIESLIVILSYTSLEQKISQQTG